MTTDTPPITMTMDTPPVTTTTDTPSLTMTTDTPQVTMTTDTPPVAHPPPDRLIECEPGIVFEFYQGSFYYQIHVAGTRSKNGAADGCSTRYQGELADATASFTM